MCKFLGKYLEYLNLKLIIYFILGFISNILILIQPLIIGKLIDNLVSTTLSNDTKLYYLQFHCILLIIIFFSKLFAEFYYKILLQKLNTSIIHNINKDFITMLQNSSYRSIVNQDKTYLVHRITSDSTVLVTFFLQNSIDLIISILSVAWIIIVFYNTNTSMLYILGFFVPIYILVYLIFKERIYKKSLLYKESLDKYFSLLNEQISSYKFLKINQLFIYMKSKLDSIFDLHLKNIISYSKTVFIFSSSSAIIGQSMNIAFLLIGGIKVINSTLSIGILSSLNSYFSIILEKISLLVNFGQDYQTAKVSLNRLKELENMEAEKYGENLIDSINEINLSNVTLSLNDNKILNKINYTFKRGNIYNIKGKNGSGKSSLINILLGLYKSDCGEILYNNNNMELLDFNSIRKKLISVVEQEPTILCDTIINNIKLDNDVEQDTFNTLVDKLNIKYLLDVNSQNNIINDSISGGEKQKISIMRSLVKKSDVIIMDEFNSALDKKSEEILMEILQIIKKNKIIILITHDNYFDNISDYIIKIENGTII